VVCQCKRQDLSLGNAIAIHRMSMIRGLLQSGVNQGIQRAGDSWFIAQGLAHSQILLVVLQSQRRIALHALDTSDIRICIRNTGLVAQGLIGLQTLLLILDCRTIIAPQFLHDADIVVGIGDARLVTERFE
jgi:hypothetical protein